MKNVTITAKENYPVIQHRLEIIHDFKNQITLRHFLMVLSEHAFLLRKPDAFGILDVCVFFLIFFTKNMYYCAGVIVSNDLNIFECKE